MEENQNNIININDGDERLGDVVKIINEEDMLNNQGDIVEEDIKNPNEKIKKKINFLGKFEDEIPNPKNRGIFVKRLFIKDKVIYSEVDKVGEFKKNITSSGYLDFKQANKENEKEYNWDYINATRYNKNEEKEISYKFKSYGGFSFKF